MTYNFVKASFKAYNIKKLSDKVAEVKFPKFINASIYINLEGIDWSKLKINTPKNIWMWKYSLYWVGSFFSNQKEIGCWFRPFVDVSIKSYLSAYEDLHEFFIKMPSCDHACAFRITACLLWLDNTPGEIETKQQAKKVLTSEANWLLEKVVGQGDSVNNHAVMSLMAIANFLMFFGEQGGVTWKKLEKTLQNVLASIFDSDGYANENTIGYHIFNVRLVKEFYDFLKTNWSEEEVSWLRKFVDGTEELCSKLIYQNGDVPPIGDSHVYNSYFKSINKSTLLKYSGLAIFKRSDQYLSLICGFRHKSHKHLDDTSFTLKVDNVDYIIDSGLYNYNQNDQNRLNILSSKAHSGIFPEALDEISRDEYIGVKKTGLSVNGEILDFREDDNNSFYISCRNRIVNLHEKDYTIERLIFSFFKGDYSILDRCMEGTSESGLGCMSSIRFILPKWVSVISERYYKNKLVFEISGELGTYYIVPYFKIEKTIIERAMVSEKKGELLQTSSITFNVIDSGSLLRTRLIIGSLESIEGDIEPQKLQSMQKAKRFLDTQIARFRSVK